MVTLTEPIYCRISYACPSYGYGNVWWVPEHLCYKIAEFQSSKVGTPFTVFIGDMAYAQRATLEEAVVCIENLIQG